MVVAAGVALALIHWKNNSSEQATGTPAALFGSAQSVIRHSESTIGAATTPVQAPVPNTSSEPESLDPALATPPPQNPLIDHFPGAKLVAWTDLPANTEGYAQRVLILETNFRFPLVRMTVERKLDAHGKVIAVRDREMMA
ncbi:MAG: hypothetical protein ACXVBW_05575, partial [Bdellovibrionota bacterium]